jgi:glycosyltransferase involved in cell wall biosynthesis
MTPDLNFPKTLIVDLSRNYGGSTSRVLSLLARFSPGEVVLAGLDNGAVTREARRLGLPVRVVGRHKADGRIVGRLIRLIREEGFQVLDSQNIQSKFYASLATAWTRTTLISTINSWYAKEHGRRSIKGRIYTALELLTNWNLSLYITVSEKDRQALLEAGRPAGGIELIYNAVDVSPIPLAESDRLRNKLDLPWDAVVCTAVGRLVPIKGYDVLIEAARMACRHVPQLVCVIIGDGKSRLDLARQIKTAGLERRVILAGHYDRRAVLAALQSSDMFVMPSRYEGTPIAVLEAAALARPILASSTGGIPEMVTDGEQALLVPPGDAAALAAGMIRLCEDRALAKRLGENARQHVQKNFNLVTQASATRDAYRNAWLKHQREK